MREASLPSPGTGASGYHLRRVSAKDISGIQKIAQKYPNGNHPNAAPLRNFFLACAAAVANFVAGLAPDNTVLPAITGTSRVGFVLTASTGTWIGEATIVYTYRWFANGVVIPAATAATYTAVVGDLGKVITAEVTGTNAHGNKTAVSAATVAVIAA